MRAINLKTNHLTAPVGIDAGPLFLSWQCADGVRQTAYEIEVTANNKTVWQSGKVQSGAMHADTPAVADSRVRGAWKIRLWDENDVPGAWSEARFETGLAQCDWVGEWVDPETEPIDIPGDDAINAFARPNWERKQAEKEAAGKGAAESYKPHRPASYLRKSFTASKGEARLYITAKGLYAAWLDGKHIGDMVLAPGSFTGNKHLGAQTYDVTALLHEGENELLIALGDGWHRSTGGVDGDRDLFGDTLGVLFQLEVDGKPVCVSDDTMQATQCGPIRQNDMQQGEVYNAQLEGELTGWHGVRTYRDDLPITGMNTVPILEHEAFPGKLLQTPNGETVLDFGQNIAGYVEITLIAHTGQKVKLTCGEALDENGNFTQENFQDRNRHKEGGTAQMLELVCKEGKNHFKPSFTIMGFRYAKVETDADLTDAVFTAYAVYSDMAVTGAFTCGNDAVNRLVKNSVWSQKGNFCDVPTDCPTRERAGWTGDMGVFIETGLTLMDCYPVAEKWLAECRLNQYPDGRMANIAPPNARPGYMTPMLCMSAGWGDAAILVPYAMYKRTGDRKILADNYEMMQRWYAFLLGRAQQTTDEQQGGDYAKFTVLNGMDYGECNLITVFKYILLQFLPAAFANIPKVDFGWPGIEVTMLGATFKWNILGYDAEHGGLPYFCAYMIAMILGEVINFPIQRNVVFRSKGNLTRQIVWYAVAFCVITCIVNSINCIWVATAARYVPDFIYNIGTTVLNGGVSMVIFFFVNKVIFPTSD